jgi:hypothetical protein
VSKHAFNRKLNDMRGHVEVMRAAGSINLLPVCRKLMFCSKSRLQNTRSPAANPITIRIRKLSSLDVIVIISIFVIYNAGA